MARDALKRPDQLQPSADDVQARHPDAHDADGDAVRPDDLAAARVGKSRRQQHRTAVGGRGGGGSAGRHQAQSNDPFVDLHGFSPIKARWDDYNVSPAGCQRGAGPSLQIAA